MAQYFRARLQQKQQGEEQKATIMIKFDHSHKLVGTLAPLINNAIEIEGGKRLLGAAPRRQLEREISGMPDGGR